MKKVITILILLFGIYSLGHGQTTIRAKAERLISKRDKEIKPHRQMSHFAKAPKDKNMRYNGTQNRRRQVLNSKYKVDGNGFKSTKKIDDSDIKENVKKVRNKSTGTYIMK
jgi:hypothetical protein